jgi:hypothetical protein
MPEQMTPAVDDEINRIFRTALMALMSLGAGFLPSRAQFVDFDGFLIKCRLSLTVQLWVAWAIMVDGNEKYNLAVSVLGVPRTDAAGVFPL